jgi:hypothetical protein
MRLAFPEEGQEAAEVGPLVAIEAENCKERVCSLSIMFTACCHLYCHQRYAEKEERQACC